MKMINIQLKLSSSLVWFFGAFTGSAVIYYIFLPIAGNRTVIDCCDAIAIFSPSTKFFSEELFAKPPYYGMASMETDPATTNPSVGAEVRTWLCWVGCFCAARSWPQAGLLRKNLRPIGRSPDVSNKNLEHRGCFPSGVWGRRLCSIFPARGFLIRVPGEGAG